MRKGAVILFVVAGYGAPGQNLVSNGSFAELDSCPPGSITHIDYVKDWSSGYYWPGTPWDPHPSYGSTDFYTNDCGNSIWGRVPVNFAGIQPTRAQRNYGGFGYLVEDFWAVGVDYVEGIQNHLKDTLIAGREYCFQAYISLSDGNDINGRVVHINMAASQFEVLLTEERYLYPSLTADTSVVPDLVITNPEYWKDRESWMPVRGSFIADGGEQWLSMANFSPLDSLDLFRFDNHQGECYYYIEDVSLYLCDTPIYQADAGVDQGGCVGDTLTFSTPYRNGEYHHFWMDEAGDTLSETTSLTVTVEGDAEYYLAQWDFKYDLTWDTVRVILDYCPELELPNVFTPNGDGHNELWRPIGEDIGQVELSIYSRWGRSVYTYSGALSSFGGWDGGSSPAGTYYVVVRALAPDGLAMEQKGILTLLR